MPLAASGLNWKLLALYGRARYLVWASLAAVVFHMAVVTVLITAWGVLGAAIAASRTLALLNGVRQGGVGRRTASRSVDPRYASVYAALVAAVAGLVLIDVFVSPSPLGALVLVAVASIVVVFARTRLGLAENSPEPAEMPVVGRLLSPSGSRT